jgi:hypothetical protein
LLSSDIFPTRLKFSVVKRAFKNGDKRNTCILNYRPISLLTAFFKVFKKVIYARLYQHLSQNDILLNEQYGSRSSSSTYMASFKLINEISLAMNNKFTVSGIFCDLEKAFDCINHDILSKLEFYGVVSKFNTLITSYLKDRYQQVVIGNGRLITVLLLDGREAWSSTRLNSWSTVFPSIYQ